jgi:hypothetical protein
VGEAYVDEFTLDKHERLLFAGEVIPGGDAKTRFYEDWFVKACPVMAGPADGNL